MDPQKRAEMSTAARQRVADHFDWDRKLEQMSEFYERAIAARRAD